MITIIVPEWAFWLLIGLFTINAGLELWEAILSRKILKKVRETVSLARQYIQKVK